MKLSAFDLKALALVAMVAEHSARYFPEWLPPGWPVILCCLGRIVIPIFFFLSIESLHKTRDRARYLRRLWLWGGAMALGNLALPWGVGQLRAGAPAINQNILLSIALGVSGVAAWEWANAQEHPERTGAWLLPLACAVGLLATEAGMLGLLLYGVFGFFRRHDAWRWRGFLAVCALYLAWALTLPASEFWSTGYQWLMVLALPLLEAHDGSPGRVRLQALFYVAYPVHVWILYGVAVLLLGHGRVV